MMYYFRAYCTFFLNYDFLCLMLYFTKQLNKTVIGIWKIDETEDQILSMLSRHDWLYDTLSAKSESRRLEKLAVRALLKEMAKEEKQILYHSSGRPFLADNSFRISISHTKGYVAIALNKKHHVGIDIEYPSERVKRVRAKLIREDEYIDQGEETTHLLLHFSAKESLFKVMEAEEIDFIRHLYIEPFEIEKEGYFNAREEKTPSRSEYKIYYRVEKDFVLTCIY